MTKEIINELASYEEVELVYVNNGQKDNKTFITYNIVCNVDNVLENIEVFKRIVATMEILKELVSTHNIIFNYNVGTSNSLEQDILNKDRRVIKSFNNSTILYNRSGYFTNTKSDEAKRNRR